MRQSPPIEEMRVFAALADAGSFTGAARALGMPKQTVSRRVAALEEALGVRLVNRTTRQVRLTQAGQELAQRCAEIVRLAREAVEHTASATETPTGTLRVTAPEALGEAFLVPAVAAYMGAYPGVSVEVLLAERRVDLVAEGFDVAIRVGRLEDSSLVATRLGPADVRYVASPAYLARAGRPDAPEDLGAHDCIVHGSEARLSRWPFAGAVVSVDARLALNHVGAVKRACASGLGIALLPRFLVADDLRAGRLVSVLDLHLPDLGAIWAVTPSRRLLSARVRAFLDVVRGVAVDVLDAPGA